MNIKEIQEMIKVMQDNEIVEFQLERNGFKIILKRGKASGDVITTSPQVVSTPSQMMIAKEEIKEKEMKNFMEIVSPMVGTFYAAPSPDSASYMQAGQQVQVGEVACIIEAMKVMNEIKSEVSGVIIEVLVENGQPVEYGQPLFKVQPISQQTT